MKAKQIVEPGSLGQSIAMSQLQATLKPPEYFAAEDVRWQSSRRNGWGGALTNIVREIDLLQYLVAPVVMIHAEHIHPYSKIRIQCT